MKKLIASLFGAVVAIVVALLHDNYLTKQLHWPESAALIGAIASGMVLLIIYEAIDGSRSLARRLSPASRVEGAWRITLQNGPRPVGLCKLEFTRKDFVYYGYGINPDGTVGASWISRDLHYDEQVDELSFTSDGSINASGRRVRNYGYIKFSRNSNGKYEYGNGYFVDMAETLSQSHMTLARIPNKTFDELVKASFEKTNREQDLVADASVPALEAHGHVVRDGENARPD